MYVSDKRSNKTMKQINNVDFDQNNIDCIFTVHGHEQMTNEVFIDGKSVVAIIDSGAGVDINIRKEFKAQNFRA